MRKGVIFLIAFSLFLIPFISASNHCSNYTYSDCPSDCEKKCISGTISCEDLNDPSTCIGTSVCDGEGSCYIPEQENDS